MNSLYETVHSTNTLLGIQNQLYRDIGKVNVNLAKSLNECYGILPDTYPIEPPTMQYFGIGTNGWNSGANAPRIPSATNLNIFNHVPILIVEKDIVLSSIDEYADYRIWKPAIIDSVEYIKFYLKKINFIDSVVRLSKVDNASGTTTEYIHDVSIFTPPTTEIINSTEHIVASLEGMCEITGEEITSTNTILDLDGVSELISSVSEIGFYVGEDFTHNIEGVDYTESIATQLAIHRCMYPFSVASTSIKYNIPINFINGSRAVLSS